MCRVMDDKKNVFYSDIYIPYFHPLGYLPIYSMAYINGVTLLILGDVLGPNVSSVLFEVLMLLGLKIDKINESHVLKIIAFGNINLWRLHSKDNHTKKSCDYIKGGELSGR